MDPIPTGAVACTKRMMRPLLPGSLPLADSLHPASRPVLKREMRNDSAFTRQRCTSLARQIFEGLRKCCCAVPVQRVLIGSKTLVLCLTSLFWMTLKRLDLHLQTLYMNPLYKRNAQGRTLFETCEYGLSDDAKIQLLLPEMLWKQTHAFSLSATSVPGSANLLRLRIDEVFLPTGTFVLGIWWSAMQPSLL